MRKVQIEVRSIVLEYGAHVKSVASLLKALRTDYRNITSFAFNDFREDNLISIKIGMRTRTKKIGTQRGKCGQRKLTNRSNDANTARSTSSGKPGNHQANLPVVKSVRLGQKLHVLWIVRLRMEELVHQTLAR